MTKAATFDEMGLEDLLTDPLVALVLRSDGITVEVLREQMQAVRRRMQRQLQRRVPAVSGRYVWTSALYLFDKIPPPLLCTPSRLPRQGRS